MRFRDCQGGCKWKSGSDFGTSFYLSCRVICLGLPLREAVVVTGASQVCTGKLAARAVQLSPNHLTKQAALHVGSAHWRPQRRRLGGRRADRSEASLILRQALVRTEGQEGRTNLPGIGWRSGSRPSPEKLDKLNGKILRLAKCPVLSADSL